MAWVCQVLYLTAFLERTKMTGLAFPDISPIIFSIGPLSVRWYSMAYLFGILFGWFLVNRYIEKYKINLSKTDIEDLVFYITLGIILGGRLGYVLFYGTSSFWHNPLQILAIWQGGMSFHGGIIGVITAIYLFSRKIKYPFLEITDLVVLVVPVGVFLGRIANFINDELWGRVTDVAWAVRFPNGGYLPRHPSQLYESLLEGLLTFIVLNVLWRKKWVREHTGFVSSLFVLCYGVFRISMEQFRQPDAHMGFYLNYFTMGQILSLPLVIVGIWVLIISSRRKVKP